MQASQDSESSEKGVSPHDFKFHDDCSPSVPRLAPSSSSPAIPSYDSISKGDYRRAAGNMLIMEAAKSLSIRTVDIGWDIQLRTAFVF